MTYRLATLDDLGLLAELNEQLIHDEQSSTRLTRPQLAKRMREWLQGHYRAVLFEENGKVVAYTLYCTGERNPGEIFYFVRQFFVCRDYRRKGIGTEAVRLLSSEIIPSTEHLVLDVMFNNEAGRAFWKKVGFTENCITLELPPRTPPD